MSVLTRLFWCCLLRIDPDEEGQSDDTEELSMNTESGADTTDQDMMAESSAGNQSSSSSQLAQPLAELDPPKPRYIRKMLRHLVPWLQRNCIDERTAHLHPEHALRLL